MAIEVLNGPTIAAGREPVRWARLQRRRDRENHLPSRWTYADITFQTSSDGIGFNDVMRPDGLEVSCAVFPGTCVIGMELVTGFLKIRSGSRDRPVEQEESARSPSRSIRAGDRREAA